MGDLVLSVFHSTLDAQGKKGCLSLYYSNYIPVISFSRYLPDDNDDVQEYPFPTISSISIDTEKEGENFLNIFVKGQLISASIFRLPSKNDILSFIHITVSNGILNSDTNRQNPNRWIPVQNSHLKPQDPIQWIYDNSVNLSNSHFSFSSIYLNSHPPFCENPQDGTFSITKHREILRELIEKGKQTDMYQKLNHGSLKDEFYKIYKINNRNKNYFNSNDEKEMSFNQSEIISKEDEKIQNTDTKLFEYLTVRKQWESRISHQNLNNSKHNNDVEKILKDLPRTISNEKIIILLYNVLRSIITYAPDVGFAQGMVDVSYFIARIILDENESFDDEWQSQIFWGLHEILFKFGQSKWFQDLDASNIRLIKIIDTVLSEIYPSLVEFIRFNDYEIFKHCFGTLLTMFTRMFSKEIEEKLWKLIFLKGNVEVFHASVLATILCINYPKLCESKTSDMSHITDLLNSNYAVDNEESFFALIALISEMIRSTNETDDSFDFSCSLFQPLSY